MKLINLFLRGLLVIGLVLFSVACEEDDNPAVPDPDLSISVTSLNFQDATDTLEFFVTNNGGGTLTWSAADTFAWLSASPASGSLAESASIRVLGIVDRTSLIPMNYSGELNINTNGGNESIAVSMVVGSQLFSYNITTDADLDLKWNVSDDDAGSGEDKWGVVSSAGPTGQNAVWCAARGDQTEVYDNDMLSFMGLNDANKINIAGFAEIHIRFWMKYRTQANLDNMYVRVLDTADEWSLADNDQSKWTGGDFEWAQYNIPLSSWSTNTPTANLQFAFDFLSNQAEVDSGAYVTGIEVWGK